MAPKGMSLNVHFPQTAGKYWRGDGPSMIEEMHWFLHLRPDWPMGDIKMGAVYPSGQ